jgi:hypothetical protein
MKWLLIVWALEAAWVPEEIIGLHGSETLGRHCFDKVSQTVSLDATMWDTLHFWTSIELYETPVTLFSYAPYDSRYYIGADVLLGPVTVGIEHYCWHPVLTWEDTTTELYGGRTKVFVKIEGSTSW